MGTVMKLADSKRRTLFSLFAVFFKIGAFTWGGGYVMLPLIRNEVVEKKKWLSPEEFLNGIAVAQSIPGAIAINAATFVGDKVCGRLGAVVAALGATIPSFVSLVIVSIFFLRFRELTIVQNFFRGATPAIAALLVSAVLQIGRTALKDMKAIAIAALLLFLLLYFHLHPILVILTAAVTGLVIRIRK